MISHRRNLRIPKIEFLVVYYKDPLQELLFGFTETYLLWCCSVFLTCFLSLTAALYVMLTPIDMGKDHPLVSIPCGQQHS